ncbi:hypothetical protein BDZ97DRAFT_1831688 [Flammula alnicola]|nr:hypothetical protein BDZ97DRAFT_1831688 [Flammula alnicola]
MKSQPSAGQASLPILLLTKSLSAFPIILYSYSIIIALQQLSDSSTLHRYHWNIKMISTTTALTLLAALLISGAIDFHVFAKPNPLGMGRRAAPDNTVVVNGADNYCLVVPRDSYTNVGDSEYPGGTTVYCTPPAHSSPDQGVMPGGFWRNVAYTTGAGSGRYAQLTGCINPSTLDRINADDEGGQYDSSGGAGGSGNPAGSACAGYNHYVELLEPAGPRACIRCCDDPADCPTTEDRSGCPEVIPGNYFDCA